MSARAFADARGIPRATMYWWRNRLRRRREQAELVPVEVVGRDTVAGRRDLGRGDFELQLDGTTTLRIPPGFDEAELRRVIRAVRC